VNAKQNYDAILHRIVAEIKSARIVAAHRVNASLVQMYWNIGRRLSEENLEKGYGSGVVERLAVDLKREFPDAAGFSSRNLWDMKRFYEFYALEDSQPEILRQAVAESGSQILRQSVAVSGDTGRLPQSIAVLPWGHHLLILNKVKEREEALFYIESAANMGWTRNVLLNFIKADTYKTAKRLPKQHNFKETLPEHLWEQADEMLKSSYNFGFLGIAKPVKERELEKRLVEKIKFFYWNWVMDLPISETNTGCCPAKRNTSLICCFLIGN